MAMKMRAVDIRNEKGPADALYINANYPRPEPGAGEALVQIKAFGLNRMDLSQREGRYPVPPQAPKVLGVEFSGVIKSLGPGPLAGFRYGDEVFGLAYGGAYAEYIAVSLKMLIRKPKELSWVQAAGIPETWITATQALYLVGCFQKGQSVLWHAGASSVSIAGIQLAKHSGASAVYVTAGSQEKIDFCVNTLSATAGFNYHTQNWAEEIQKVTDGKGVDVIIDFIGATYFQSNLTAAARDAHIVSLSFLGGNILPAGIDISPFLLKRIRWEGSSLRSRDSQYQGKLRDRLVEEALPEFQSGKFQIHVERTFRMEDIVEAHKLMESNQTKGKLICTIE